MRFLKKGLSFAALLAMTAQSYAADLCDPVASAALKTAAIQQELMVAGFTCNALPQYNHFVTEHQPAPGRPAAGAVALAPGGARPWPETLAARTAVSRLLQSWDEGDASRLFASNVVLDAPFAERKSTLDPGNQGRELVLPVSPGFAEDRLDLIPHCLP